MNPIFYIDVASPNAYLAHQIIPAIEARTGATFIYQPTLLGGLFKLSGNQAPMLAFAGIPAKLAYERREMERFIAKHGVTRFAMNPHFPVNTLLAMRTAAAAEAAGVLRPYLDATLVAMWEEGQKLDDPAVLGAVIERAGLPAADLLAAGQEAPAKERLLASTQDAFDHGAFGIPTFRVGEEIYFGKDKLGDVEEAILAAK